MVMTNLMSTEFLQEKAVEGCGWRRKALALPESVRSAHGIRASHSICTDRLTLAHLTDEVKASSF